MKTWFLHIHPSNSATCACTHTVQDSFLGNYGNPSYFDLCLLCHRHPKWRSGWENITKSSLRCSADLLNSISKTHFPKRSKQSVHNIDSFSVIRLFFSHFVGPFSELNLNRISQPHLFNAQMKTIHYISRWPAWDVCVLKPRAPTLPAGHKLMLGPPEVLWRCKRRSRASGTGGQMTEWQPEKAHVMFVWSLLCHGPHLLLPPPFPALLLALFSPPPCHSEVRVSATHTRGGACIHRQTPRDCNSMVECIIDGSALKDPLLIL